MFLLTESKSSNIISVNLPNGATTEVTHTITVIFNPKLTLKNVLCVPSFNLNLVLDNKLTNDLNFCIIFFPEFCILQDLVPGKMIGLDRQCGGLYYMHPSKNKLAIFHDSQSSNLWHLHLGHPTFSRFKLRSHLLPDHPKELRNNSTICPKDKQTCLPSPKISITTKFPFFSFTF